MVRGRNEQCGKDVTHTRCDGMNLLALNVRYLACYTNCPHAITSIVTCGCRKYHVMLEHHGTWTLSPYDICMTFIPAIDW